MLEINTNRIHETVRLIAGNDRLELEINLDPMAFMGQMADIVEALRTVNEKDDNAIRELARDYAEVMLGKPQAIDFMAFYGGDGKPALMALSKIFNEAVNPKLTAAQESAGRKSIRRRLRDILRKRA